MRLLGRLLVLLAAVAAAVWGYAYWESVRPQKMVRSGDDRLAGATRALAYSLPAEGWLVFPVEPAAQRMFRLLTNANVTPAQAADPTAVIEYVLQYRVLDGNGAILDSVEHVHRTRVSHYRDERNPEDVQFGAFYRDRDYIPSDGRTVLVNFERWFEAAQVHVRLATQHAAVESAIVRAYQRERLPEYKLANRWERLGEERRSRLSRGNVYDYEFLTREEKLSLVRHRWNPVAPLGVPDVDFYQQMVYLRDELVGDPIREPVIPHGLIVDVGMHGTIALPHLPNGVYFEIEPIEPGQPLRAEIRWRGDDSQRREETVVDAEEPVTRINLHYDEPGLVEIITNGALAVRVSSVAEDGEIIDLTPRPRYLRAYLIAPGQTVDYDITHTGERPTPLRVDARALLASDEEGAELGFTVALLSASGAAVDTLPCEVNVAATAYDRAQLVDDDSRRASEPASCYIQVPSAAARVRLRAERAVLISAYTRPPDLTKEVEVPYDYASFQSERAPLPTWFYLRPRDRIELARQGRSIQLVTQGRPKDEDEDLLAGRYRWDEFQPAGNWVARYVLNPRDSRLPLRDQALATVFHPIRAEREQTLEFRGAPGKRTLIPRVIFTKSGAGEMSVSVTIDDRTVTHRRLRGDRGEFRLPPLMAGQHTLKLSSDRAADWFINHAKLGGEARIRRLAIRLSGEVMRFKYRKQQATEVLTGHLQVPFGASAPAHLRVAIVPARPRTARVSTEWSVLTRRYVIHPDSSAAVPTLGGGDAQVDRGRRFFIPLNADLPAGDYEIRMWLENAGTAYVTLYRLTPGRYNRGKLFREYSVGEPGE